MYTILNEGQEQGLWETLASMTSTNIVNLVEDSDSDLENSDDDEDEQQNAKLFHCYVQLPFRIYVFSCQKWISP
jgi:hypothetical protein